MDTSGPGVRVPDSGTLGRESSSVGTHWIVSETPVSTIRLGHLGSFSCRASCHSHFPCSFKSAHCPLLPGVPRDHLCWDTLGPPARLLWDTPCPPVLAPHLSPLRTPVPLCVSLLGATLHLSTKESRGSTFHPRSTLLGPTWTPDTCPTNSHTIAIHCHCSSFCIASIIFPCINSHQYYERHLFSQYDCEKLNSIVSIISLLSHLQRLKLLNVDFSPALRPPSPPHIF